MMKANVLRWHVLYQLEEVLVFRNLRVSSKLKDQALVSSDLCACIPHGLNPNCPVMVTH